MLNHKKSDWKVDTSVISIAVKNGHNTQKYLLEQNCITYFIKIVDFILFLHPKKLDQSLVGDEERSFIEVFDLNSHYHPKNSFLSIRSVYRVLCALRHGRKGLRLFISLSQPRHHCHRLLCWKTIKVSSTAADTFHTNWNLKNFCRVKKFLTECQFYAKHSFKKSTSGRLWWHP